VDIDPAKNTRDFAVKHGTGDAFLVFGHNRMVTGTRFLRIAIIAARAGIYTIEHIFRAWQMVKG
jgi:hypothetical protein